MKEYPRLLLEQAAVAGPHGGTCTVLRFGEGLPEKEVRCVQKILVILIIAGVWS